eukprot:jgi/Mesvir1/28186/Mv04743-RA.1
MLMMRATSCLLRANMPSSAILTRMASFSATAVAGLQNFPSSGVDTHRKSSRSHAKHMVGTFPAGSHREAGLRHSQGSFLTGQLHSRHVFSGFQAVKLVNNGRRSSGNRNRHLSVSASAEDDQQFDFDLFTIGAGSGGVRASRMSAGFGAKVAVCELPFALVSSDTEGGIGGTCVLRGCVPKKLLVYASSFGRYPSVASGFGWDLPSPPTFSWERLMASKDKELRRLNGVYLKLLEGSKVTVIEGRGKVVGPHTVQVGDKTYSARHILVATGSRSVVPDIPGRELALTSDNALTLPTLPRRVVIVGAGYIALEFAGIFSGMGAEVDLVYRAPLPLRGFDDEVRSFIVEEYTKKGIHMHPSTSPTSLAKNEDGTVTLNTSGGPLTGDVVLFATGRKPNSKGLGLEDVGVTLGKGGAVQVDGYSRTSVPSIYAVGDVTDRINLTPVALMEGMALAKTLFAKTPTKPDHRDVPAAVFSQPEIATVGLTEQQAMEAYPSVDVYVSTFKPMKYTLLPDATTAERALLKLVVDHSTDRVLGAHMVGPEAAEIMQGLGVALKCGATKAQLDATVGIHPTAAEEFVTMRSVTRRHRSVDAGNAPAAAIKASA